jgi:hypothetical protein
MYGISPLFRVVEIPAPTFTFDSAFQECLVSVYGILISAIADVNASISRLLPSANLLNGFRERQKTLWSIINIRVDNTTASPFCFCF